MHVLACSRHEGRQFLIFSPNIPPINWHTGISGCRAVTTTVKVLQCCSATASRMAGARGAAAVIWDKIKDDNKCGTYPTICLGRTRAQLEAESPSRLDGISPADELVYRKDYCELIQETGRRLKMCASSTLATSGAFCFIVEASIGLTHPLNAGLCGCRIQSGVASAMVICHRYFACKSLKHNDCFVRIPFLICSQSELQSVFLC